MKVALINGICGWQSTGKIVSDIQQTVKAEGGECVIAYGESASTKVEGNYKIASESNRYIHALYTRVTGEHGFLSIKPTKKLIDFLEEYKPDIINIHNIHGYYLNVELLFEYFHRAQVPVVWTLHDCWSFTGHCAYFDMVECDRWRTGCHDCPQRLDYPKSYVDKSKWNYKKKKKIFTRLDASQLTLVTPSAWLKELVGESYLGKYNVKVINNGIDKAVFKHTDSDILKIYGIQDKKIVLGVALPWSERKGLRFFYELSMILPDEYKIVLIGLDDKQIADLPQNILGIKRTKNAKELAEWYSAAYVFANPTLEDNYPTVNLEAISCGTPVITFDTGGSGESARLFGTVTKEKTAVALANAIETIKVNRESSVDFGKDKSAVEYLHLYKSVLKYRSIQND